MAVSKGTNHHPGRAGPGRETGVGIRISTRAGGDSVGLEKDGGYSDNYPPAQWEMSRSSPWPWLTKAL